MMKIIKNAKFDCEGLLSYNYDVYPFYALFLTYFQKDLVTKWS